MAVQSFVKGDDLKKLIDDKLINAQSVKYVLRQKGILPVCTNSEALSDLIHHHFFGSATMTQMQEVMNFGRWIFTRQRQKISRSLMERSCRRLPALMVWEKRRHSR